MQSGLFFTLKMLFQLSMFEESLDRITHTHTHTLPHSLVPCFLPLSLTPPHSLKNVAGPVTEAQACLEDDGCTKTQSSCVINV